VSLGNLLNGSPSSVMTDPTPPQSVTPAQRQEGSAPMQGNPSLRHYASLPVHIVEDHNDAIVPLLRAVATRHIPFAGNLLLHWDSHPDLLLPDHLTRAKVFDKAALLESLSIENWILPAVFAGHFSTVIWVKPPWSNQIPDGEYKFYVGVQKKTGVIKVSSDLLYYVSELLFCSEDEMEDKKPLTLRVLTVGCLDGSQSEAGSSRDSSTICRNSSDFEYSPTNGSAELAENEDTRRKRIKLEENEGFSSSSYICVQDYIKEHDGIYALDIDLDFFTTLNPFIDMYKSVNMYQRLQSIYLFELDSNKSLEQNQTSRQNNVKPLETFFMELDKIGDPKIIRTNLIEMAEKFIPSIGTREAIVKLVEDILESHGDDLEKDWIFVHYAGCTIDSPLHVLPHHPSSEAEILTLVRQCSKFLGYLLKPKLVTLARSSLDDYCPPDKVDFVQDELLKKLNDLYGSVNVLKSYEQ